MKKIISVMMLLVVMTVFVGCPPVEIRKADPYIKQAKEIVEVLNKEYPGIKQAILDTCDAKLIDAKSCEKIKEIDPIISKSLVSLIDALALYQSSVDAYEAALKDGDTEASNAKWNEISAALGVVVGKTGELVGLYIQVLDIYKQVTSKPTTAAPPTLAEPTGSVTP